MAYRYTDYQYLFHHAPEELKKTWLSAVRECSGNVVEACEYVGLTRRQFYVWAKRLDLLEKIQEIRDEFRKGRVALPRETLDTSEFGYLARTDPDEAKTVLKLAYNDSRDVAEAAQALGISPQIFYRYCRRWNLFPELLEAVKKRTAGQVASRRKARGETLAAD